MFHFVYFDGSSYFVDDATFVCDQDTTIVFKSKDLDEACDFADAKNDALYQ